MNRSFDVCGKCRFYADNPRKDQWTFEGFCLNESYSRKFRINSTSESCERGELREGADNSKIPDRIPEKGEYND